MNQTRFRIDLSRIGTDALLYPVAKVAYCSLGVLRVDCAERCACDVRCIIARSVAAYRQARLQTQSHRADAGDDPAPIRRCPSPLHKPGHGSSAFGCGNAVAIDLRRLRQMFLGGEVGHAAPARFTVSQALYKSAAVIAPPLFSASFAIVPEFGR